MRRTEPSKALPEMRAVGNTPLIEIEGVFAKLECANPCGSIKDRIALYILEESESRNLLREGMRIVEATSGNTGIAFAFYGKRMGYETTIVMPENVTDERKEILNGLGAELILCSAEGSFRQALGIRDRLAGERGFFNPDQFSNPLNARCHFETTGEEILRQIRRLTDRPIDAFVAGVGTGGTVMGVGRRIKTLFPEAWIVAVEPEESPVMSGGAPGAHGIPGIGDGFIPAIVSDGEGGVHPSIDRIILIGSEEAKRASQYLNEAHGFCVGISSGANFLAAKMVAERFPTVVTVFPDGFRKYVSRGLRHCEPGRCPFEHTPAV